MTTYQIDNIRAVKPTGKVAENNPDRFITVYGVFHDEDGNELSITSKPVTFDEATNPDFNIDLVAGTLTIPSGARGRKAFVSLSNEDILADLETLRNS